MNDLNIDGFSDYTTDKDADGTARTSAAAETARTSDADDNSTRCWGRMSRQTWLGVCGVVRTASIVVFLGLFAFAAFMFSAQIDRGVLNIREALGALLLRVSPTVERIQNILLQSKV